MLYWIDHQTTDSWCIEIIQNKSHRDFMCGLLVNLYVWIDNRYSVRNVTNERVYGINILVVYKSNKCHYLFLYSNRPCCSHIYIHFRSQLWHSVVLIQWYELHILFKTVTLELMILRLFEHNEKSQYLTSTNTFDNEKCYVFWLSIMLCRI